MEELSWRARLAKSNINILNVDRDKWYYEFMYHPKPGQVKWCKTFYEFPDGDDQSPEAISGDIRKEVLQLRKELEG